MLDDVLRERFIPAPPSNLAYRIIEAAKPRGQEKSLGDRISWAGAGRAIGEIFVIPQPAFAMAVILILGIYAGTAYVSEQDIETQMAHENFSSFITADVSVDYGEFL